MGQQQLINLVSDSSSQGLQKIVCKMGVSLTIFPIYLLSVLLCVQSQIYGQYGYPQYGQYIPGQNPVYTPYPYQPYVSSQPASYFPYYGYPGQGYIPQNYPTYGYPAQTYPSQTYPTQQNYPSVYPQYPNYQPYPYVSNRNTTNSSADGKDPYADIKVEIIDVEPKYFNYYKRYFNLEDNTYPVNVIEDYTGGSNVQPQTQNQPYYNTGGSSVQSQTQNQPYYTVKTESKSFNFSSIPQGVNTHDVKSKTYSFKRTFTVDPSKKKNSVINLNFVNGVQITTTPEPTVELADQADTTVASVVTEDTVSTTTENEEPASILSWI